MQRVEAGEADPIRIERGIRMSHDIDILFAESPGGAMKALLRKRAIVRRFSLIFVLLLAVSVWTFSVSTAQEPTKKSAEQTAGPPAASALDAQQIHSTRQAADQTPAPKSAEPSSKDPAGSFPSGTQAQKTSKAELHVAPQLPGATAPEPAAAATGYPAEYSALIKKTTEALMSPNFTFLPVKALDPFTPFISLETTTQPRLPEEDAEPQGPSTPLQKMTLSEIERGLKAISWGELGRRAVIEDSTGRGYIVSVGTPAGEHSGVITQILDNRLIIQQEIWSNKLRKRFPQDLTIKLVKKTDGRK